MHKNILIGFMLASMTGLNLCHYDLPAICGLLLQWERPVCKQKSPDTRLFKKVQMRGARRSILRLCSGQARGVLLYVDAKSIERNEADEPFSTACYFS